MKREKMIKKLNAECEKYSFCIGCPIRGNCSDFTITSKKKLKKYMLKMGLKIKTGKTIKIKTQKTIKLKYFDQEIEQIQKISVGDWIDLRSAERVELKAGEYKLLRLGVGMILPDGYEAHVLPRSSTPSKFGIILANSMGVIDNSYSGDSDEWRFPAVAIRDTVIEKGDRIAQFRIVKNQPSIEFEVVDHLNDISRGGIGSTGKR